MPEQQQYPILSLLKTKLPGFEGKLDQVYWQDPVFRQIAREYSECIRKRESEIAKTSKVYAAYTATIRELKDELLEHLK